MNTVRYQLTLERQLLKKTSNTRKEESLVSCSSTQSRGHCPPLRLQQVPLWGAALAPLQTAAVSMWGAETTLGKAPLLAQHSSSGHWYSSTDGLQGQAHPPGLCIRSASPPPTPHTTGAAHLPASHPCWFTSGNKSPCSLGEKEESPTMENSHFTAERRRTEASQREEGVRQGYLWRC